MKPHEMESRKREYNKEYNIREKDNIPYNIRKKDNIPYNIKISTKTDVVDQKRDQVELRPGYRVIIRVTAAIIKTSKSFQEFDIKIQQWRQDIYPARIFQLTGEKRK